MKWFPITLLLPIFGLFSCNGLKDYVKNGYNLDKDYSIFTRYSGSYCTLKSGSGESFSVNCEKIRDMTDPQGEFCQEHQNDTWSAYFPDQSAAMQLCRSRSYPERANQEGIRFLVFGDSGAGG